MRKAIKNKLQSNRGASMMLVMALFLVCVMVSSVIIFSASKGISRNAQRADQQRGYLAISSATDLIVEEIQLSCEYVGKDIKKQYGCENCNIPITMVYFGEIVSGYRLDSEYIPSPLDDGHLMIHKLHEDDDEGKKTDDENTKITGALGKMFVRAAEHVYINETDYEEHIQIDLAVPDERIPAVDCSFTMDNQYNMRFELSSAYSDYAVFIEVSSIVDKSETVEVDTVSDAHTVYYKRFNNGTGAFEDTVNDSFVFPTEVTTYRTKVTWGIPKVEKGVLSD